MNWRKFLSLFVTIVIPIIELENPFSSTSFQIVSYCLKCNTRFLIK